MHTSISKSLKIAALSFAVLATSTQVEAQSLKERMKAAKEKLEAAAEKAAAANGTSSKQTEEVKKEEVVKELNEWHKSNQGKVVFYNKAIKYKSSSTGDSQTSVITERVLGENKPFAFRAYFGKPFKKDCETCDNLDIRYTIGDVSLTTSQVREELPAYYARMASGTSYYDYNNYSMGVSMESGPGLYYDNYTLQEDTYRLLLSKVKDKLKVGSTVTLKVEVFSIGRDKQPASDVLASGEIPIKITAASKNLQNLNCRCGKAGMTDEAMIKDIKEAFTFQFDDVTKVHKVVITDRSFQMNYDNSYPTKQIIAKGVNANIVYERNDGVFMQVKRYVFYDKTPSGFADKIKIGKHVYFVPVSPTCAL